jgi:hypothetical protein
MLDDIESLKSALSSFQPSHNLPVYNSIDIALSNNSILVIKGGWEYDRDTAT